MRRLHLALGLAGGGLLTLAAPTAAQNPIPYQFQGPAGIPQRPPVSPYLNLLPRNALPGANFYNFVRPNLVPAPPPVIIQNLPPLPPEEAAFAADFGTRAPRATGHPTAFMAYQNFFNTNGTIGAAPRNFAPRNVAAPPRR
jgi:hypothetical protein